MADVASAGRHGMTGLPSMEDARRMYSDLASVPAMPHRGPRRERTQMIFEWLQRAYELGQASSVIAPPSEVSGSG